ncbi:polysaccharide deacetylase family protein [Nakamurella lactea]|uniref:polysaccharide deacetylase family protein n=1 Tax=Nakamurella lactea TaxID=459515 RepID=UPI0006882D29|nr:polysaccharide deacetylase family protein [Nakamurella lactea]
MTTVATGAAIAHFGPAVTGIPGISARLPPAGQRSGSGIGLTFDDGPHPQGTAAVLDVLAEYRVTATFFLIAEQLRRFPDIGRRIVDDGHEVAVHGWNHAVLCRQGPVSTRRRLSQAVELISDICQVTPRWFRPPYGVATGSALLAARSLDLQPIWWNRWARDWSTAATPESIIHRSTNGLRDGEVVLLHDSDSYGTPGSWRTTAAALPGILDICGRSGLTVGSLRMLNPG